MKIREFAKGDLEAVVAIQDKNRLAAHWREADYARLAEDAGAMILVAELETTNSPKVLGFAASLQVTDEAELLNLAIHPEHQQGGVGRALLEEVRKRLLEAGAKRLYAEVRPSNNHALRLYYSVGFGFHSLRKDYYGDPREDAYVLSLELSL